MCTEECDFHHTGDVTPAVEARLWSDLDVPVMAHMVEAVKRHGSLAACELVYGGAAAHNRLSRVVSRAPGNMPLISCEPGQARAMDRGDIRDFRRWHRQGALRARDAGFDAEAGIASVARWCGSTTARVASALRPSGVMRRAFPPVPRCAPA